MNQLLGNIKKGSIFVVSAPAGTGKTTLIEMLVSEYPCVVESISYTTRKIRGEEVQGKHYHFVTRKEFENKISNVDFLEYAEIYGEYYGTSSSWVEGKRREGKHVVLVIDTQGAMKLKGKCDAVFIFIMPPSLGTLRERLEKRKTETPQAIENRLEWAKREIEVGKTEYEYIIVNHDLNEAYQVLKSIFIAEEHRAKNYNIQGE
jgi:guanylate kinase